MIIEQAAEVLKIEAQGILYLIDRLGKVLIQRDFFPRLATALAVEMEILKRSASAVMVIPRSCTAQ
ncbi:MAG: hypothetical protein KJ741_18430 [Proteobacteria bacterium]|nr:hypothetical protein [Pseudomonadota bacterium]